MYKFEEKSINSAPMRWLYVVPMAAATTFGLLLLMFKLIYMESAVIEDEPEFKIPDVTWHEPDPIEIIRKAPEEPEDIIDPPPRPEQPAIENTEISRAVPMQEYKKPDLTGKLSFNVSTPIEHFIVSPRYPGRALTKGIEGYVELRFDVNLTGATENIEVVRAEPQGVFEDAAVAAAVRWKFQPKTEKGKPVYFRGLSKLVTFEMQKS